MITADPRGRALAGLVAALATLTITITTTATGAAADPSTTTTAAAITVTAPMAAREQLAALPIRVEDTGAHYNRTAWGGWKTTGGCDTREAVLKRDGRDVVIGAGCRVTAGRWVSPYDGTAITTPAGVQIDHRVPVKEALRSGARTWTAGQRARFYNDLANLVAVSAHANTSKGDRDPGAWRPPARESWCGYATAYITTKTTYRLAVDARERDGLAAMLTTCGAGSAR